MKTPKANQIICRKVLGGKKPMWHATLSSIHPSYGYLGDRLAGVVGAGNTADNAIKDYQKQFRLLNRQGEK